MAGLNGLGMGGIYGLSGSGMDIDDLVKKMMSAQQARYDKMYKQKTQITWQKAEYNSFYKSISSFRFDTLTNFKKQSEMAAKSAHILDESIAKVQANGDAAEMSHDINVQQMAKSAYLQTKGGITRLNGDGNPIDSSSVQLRDLMGEAMRAEPTNPGKRPEAPTMPAPLPSTATQEEKDAWDAAMQQYNDDMSTLAARQNEWDTVLKPQYDQDMAEYNEYLDKTALSFRIGSTGDSTEDKIISYTYRDLLDKTLSEFASDINNLDINLSASYDTVNDSFMINNKKGGVDNKISFSVYTGGLMNDGHEVDGSVAGDGAAIQRTQNLFNNLHLAEYDDTTSSQGPELSMSMSAMNTVSVQGRNGKVIIDGVTYERDSNTFEAGNVKYTFYKEGSTKVSVSSDTEKVVDNVKKFVEEYNKMLESLNKSIHEDKYKDYLPLTDDEKSALSEEQIKKWEEKAKSGLLKNDSILKELVNGMRSALSAPISGIGEHNSMANIGISTTSNYKDYGKIELDEEKLRKALEKDPDCVYKVFGTVNRDSEYDYNSDGVMNRLSAPLKKAMDQINQRAGLSDTADDESVLGRKVTTITDKMARFMDQMDAYQARLYKQFNAMEVAIAQLNSQSSFVSQYMGGN